MKVKQAASYQEQVQILKSKGLIIEDEKECMDFLAHTNYYRLGSYCESFRKNRKGKFEQGTTFRQIKSIYMFDQKLRAILFEMVEDIEFALRTQISYYHGKKYGADGYLNPKNFNKKHDGKNFSYHIRTVIRENRDSPIVKHHNEKYDGQFPLWVIIEFFSMGMLSRFYKDMFQEDKSYIARMYSTTDVCMENWLQCVTEVRNRCAHYSRFYDWHFATAPIFEEKKLQGDDDTLFGHLLVLRNMYPDMEEWNQELLVRLQAAISRYEKDIRYEHLGFPRDWRKRLTKWQ